MSSSVQESVVGRVLDRRYRVLSHIADGGMASVYVALDERLDREVAVKIMRRALVQDETFVSRFRREARSAARLSHPHVVAVFDQGEDDGDMFLTMEYVPGRTLREVLAAEGPLTPRAALDLFDPMLQALDAAHSAGLIHRDVKPENVILREDGVVKVADFGLARAVTTATTTNASGVLLGTVAYLSPEQVERGIADARSDVYAVGLVLYEMVTGRKAFDGDTAIHVAYQHVHGSVPVPSDRVPSVPQELDQLVALATARDPDQRPATAGDYLAEVRRSRWAISTGELDVRPAASLVTDRDPSATVPMNPTTAIPAPGRTGAEGPGSGQQDTADRGVTAPPGRRERRRRWPWAVLLSVLLVLAAGGGAWWLTMGPGSRTVVPTLSQLSRTDALASLERASLRSEVTDSFDEVVPAGIVISQDPKPGAEVSKLSSVALTVSKGQERYAAPSLVGGPADAAGSTLEQSNLKLGTRTDAFSETVAVGTVISQDPPPGTSLRRDTVVTITVSKGREPVAVADFTGKPADEARRALGGAGLKVVDGPAVNSDTVPNGSVVSQTPRSGNLVKGDTVTIVVSKGPVLVAVPATVGKQRDQAAAILLVAGFKVAYQELLGGYFGTVRSSDPAEGTMVRKGSTITLTIV
jgi:serine/threonine-protein kinase